MKEMASKPLSEELEHFLCPVFSVNEPDLVQDEKTKRFIYSIGQDICRAVSLGRWKLAKHILICTTIRHLYRSKHLTSLTASVIINYTPSESSLRLLWPKHLKKQAHS